MTTSPYWLLFLTLLVPIPYSTDRRGRRVPFVTYTLIGLNVLVYLFTGPTAYERWGLVPSAPHFSALLTGLFLHIGLAHLLGNMLFLWIFGRHVEEALGWQAFLALYLGGGIAAGLLHLAVVLLHGTDTSVPLVGASGAISAILAPFAVRFHRASIRMFWVPAALLFRDWAVLEVPAVSGLILWIFWNVIGGICFLWLPDSFSVQHPWLQLLLPPTKTAYWAHVGGFVFGLVAAELTGLLRDGRQEYLLQDARAAAAKGAADFAAAVRSYRTFLEFDPDNAPVRAELARLLAASAWPDAKAIEDARLEAGLEMLAAIRAFLKRGETPEAARRTAEALSLGLALPLTPRERLRLAVAAEGLGDWETSLVLLRALVSETPDAPEDEMARLKLGELLKVRDPQEARAVLTGFLEKYSHSDLARRAREMQIQIQTNV